MVIQIDDMVKRRFCGESLKRIITYVPTFNPN